MQTEKTRHLRTRVISVLLAVLMIVTCLPSMLFPVSADNNGRSGGPLVLTNASIEFRDSKYNPIPDPEKGKEGVESGDLFYLMATISGNNVNEGEEDTYRIEITDQNLLLPNFAGNGFRDGAVYNGYVLHVNPDGSRYITFSIDNGQTKQIRLQAKFRNGKTPNGTVAEVRISQEGSGKSVSNTITAIAAMNWNASKSEDRTSLKASDIAGGTSVNYTLSASSNNASQKKGAEWVKSLTFQDTISLENMTFQGDAAAAIRNAVKSAIQAAGYDAEPTVTVKGAKADISFVLNSKNENAEMPAVRLNVALPLNSSTVKMNGTADGKVTNDLSVSGKPYGDNAAEKSIGGNSVELTVSAPKGPQFSLSKTVENEKAYYLKGDKVKFVITVTNTGDMDGDIDITDALPDGKVGEAYSQTLAADGTAPITWSISGGALPDGLKLDENTGGISGEPTAEGTATFTVKAENSGGSDTKELSITITKDAPTEYTVRFNANGGGGTMADVTGVSGSYTLPACGFTEPEGKQFKGWSTSADGSVISGTTYEVSSDTTFYAIWESKEYSIIVTDGKATIGAGSEISKAAQGTTITLTANAAPDGKVFDKWVVESGNTTLEDANSETTTFIMPDSEVSVKATYTIPHTHTYDQEIQKPETLKSAADCTNDAVYFKSCSCGEISTTETFTAAGTQLGHAWASDWSKDTDNHWKECSRCHEKKDEAAHDYGSDNICDTCGYDKTVPHTHNLTLVPAKAPTCTEKGNTAYYTCDGCDKWFEDATGASEITDKTSVILAATGHSASDWKSDNTDHWKECTVVGCGVIIEGSKAAHTAGEWIIDTPATATTDGSKHKECTVCGYTMATETIPATGGGEHTHSYGIEWKNDADNHWHECSCGDKADKAAHDFKWVVDKEATATQKGSKHEECRVCGYKKAAVEIPATGTPTEPGKPTDSDSPQTGDNSNMILWIALLFVCGGVVIGITVYSKKKKENAE